MHKVTSIRLPENLIKQLSDIAKKESISRNSFIVKAIKMYVDNYYEKPHFQTTELSKKLLDLEKKYNTILTRVDTLTRQFDRLIEKKF